MEFIHFDLRAYYFELLLLAYKMIECVLVTRIIDNSYLIHVQYTEIASTLSLRPKEKA
jgi:hypothetical protein